MELHGIYENLDPPPRPKRWWIICCHYCGSWLGTERIEAHGLAFCKPGVCAPLWLQLPTARKWPCS